VSAYLTVAEVADELGCSARTVLRWIERGDLGAVRLPGGRLRVSERDLAAHIASWATTTKERTTNDERVPRYEGA
jgi:excisionase family DNA binding protein